jgi:type I restriction enzyme S subunit
MFGDPFSDRSQSGNKKLGDVCAVSSGSTPSRKNLAYYRGTIPWVKTGEVVGERIRSTSESITATALRETSLKLYPSGTVLLAMYGQGKTRGQVGILDIEATTNQACAAISCSDELLPDFLFNQLKLGYDSIRGMGRGGNQPNMNAGIVRAIPIVVPDIALQSAYVERIKILECTERAAVADLNRRTDLLTALQQRAFQANP